MYCLKAPKKVPHFDFRFARKFATKPIPIISWIRNNFEAQYCGKLGDFVTKFATPPLYKVIFPSPLYSTTALLMSFIAKEGFVKGPLGVPRCLIYRELWQT
jgi:hypothetical protein